MAINLDLTEQKIVFDDGGANILYHPARMMIAGNK